MQRRSFLIGSALTLSGCAGAWPARHKRPVEVEPGSVTRLHVLKGERLLRLEAAARGLSLTALINDELSAIALDLMADYPAEKART